MQSHQLCTRHGKRLGKLSRRWKKIIVGSPDHMGIRLPGIQQANPADYQAALAGKLPDR